MKHFKNRRSTFIKNNFFQSLYKASEIKFKEIDHKKIFVFASIIVLLLVDTYIAGDVFRDLGIGAKAIDILGLQMSGDYALLYGFFLTAGLALFIHLVLEGVQKTAKKYEIESDKTTILTGLKFGVIVTAFTLFVVFMLLLFAVLIPDVSKQFIEIVLRIVWAVVLFVVYALSKKIIGENYDYSQLWFPVFILSLVFLLAFFGFVVLVSTVLGSIVEAIAAAIFGVLIARSHAKHRNEMESWRKFNDGYRASMIKAYTS